MRKWSMSRLQGWKVDGHVTAICHHPKLYASWARLKMWGRHFLFNFITAAVYCMHASEAVRLGWQSINREWHSQIPHARLKRVTIGPLRHMPYLLPEDVILRLAHAHHLLQGEGKWYITLIERERENQKTFVLCPTCFLSGVRLVVHCLTYHSWDFDPQSLNGLYKK